MSGAARVRQYSTVTPGWSFTLTQNGIWHTAMRDYRSRDAALKAADWHRAPMSERSSIADELEGIGL